MLATLTDAPFDDKGWVFEDKYDGFRMVAESLLPFLSPRAGGTPETDMKINKLEDIEGIR